MLDVSAVHVFDPAVQRSAGTNAAHRIDIAGIAPPHGGQALRRVDVSVVQFDPGGTAQHSADAAHCIDAANIASPYSGQDSAPC